MNEQKFKEGLERFYATNRRKDNIIVFLASVILILVVGFILFITYQARILPWLQPVSSTTQVVEKELSEDQIKRIIASIQVRDGRDGADGFNGQNGSDGRNGINGANGLNGLAGANITPDQIATAVSEYMRLNPVQALVGERGPTGERQLLELNSESCELLTKYTGDETWEILAVLPKPCV